ncbi:MAG: TIGR02757 family protein [Myxococcaceae bacterium]|nr:TIGR02757 family protein [Myxococcaceae bacterium]
MLSAARAQRLGPLLEQLARDCAVVERTAADPVELVHRYRRRDDIEVAGLLATSLAYGRPQVFKPVVEKVLTGLGKHPGAAVAELDVPAARKLLQGFVYRFNLPADLAVLLLGMGAVLRTHGTLEAPVARGVEQGGIRQGLSALVAEVRAGAPLPEIRRALGPNRGLAHLLPNPEAAGASKRLNLYLRWMVRGPDAVDFGLWKKVPASALVVPLDTHIARLSKHLGLTRRRDLGWRTAQEITGSLLRLDPRDPVRFDFPLCHHGMSGGCPVRPRAESCKRCVLRSECAVGRRLAGPP